MAKIKDKPDSELRRRAEAKLKETAGGREDLSGAPPERMEDLIFELQVHQIELEMQNDELRRIQGKLENSLDRYSHLYDFAPVGYFTISEKGSIDEVNLTGASMTGIERSALIGKPFTRIILRDDQDIFYKHQQRLLETEEPQSCELRLVKRDGHEFYARMECMVIKNRDDDSRRIRTVVSNITEQKDLENRLRQSQKLEAIGTLAGGIAHDFNNILTAVIGFTELALGDAEKGTDLRDNLEEILVGGKRAKLLVQQILAFSRKSPQKLEQLRMDALVKETLKLLRSTIPANIEIDLDISSVEVPYMMGDETQIHQVIMNLCTNAAHAMETEGGKLTIALDTIIFDNTNAVNLLPGKYVKLSVSDTGSGMAPEIVERIFEPYFSTKDPDRGTGLGLSVVEGIVKAHKGHIAVVSQLKRGTTFTVFLPMLEKVERTPYLMPQDVLPRGREHIFFIDDELFIIKLYKMILERLGYKVTTSTSSLEALESFRAAPDEFDLVITDISMPNMTGNRLAAELMKIRPDIPVIICTDYSKQMSEESVAGIGIKAVAYKPVRTAELAVMVRKVLDD